MFSYPHRWTIADPILVIKPNLRGLNNPKITPKKLVNHEFLSSDLDWEPRKVWHVYCLKKSIKIYPHFSCKSVTFTFALMHQLFFPVCVLVCVCWNFFFHYSYFLPLQGWSAIWSMWEKGLLSPTMYPAEEGCLPEKQINCLTYPRWLALKGAVFSLSFN